MEPIFDIIKPGDHASRFSRDEIADFLHEHLDEYGDPKEDILACLAYAAGDKPHRSGVILVAHDGEKILGAAVLNHTGMKGYIPENILVYIAVHSEARGQGLGKELMTRIIDLADGAIALHVEEDNPARFLYEKVGFETKYLEMRRTR
ncbi:MAG: GNAT family N-acetyltransferase [Bacteroidota bacterium]